MRQLAFNSGAEGSVIVQEIKGKSGNFGYNCETDTYEDMVQAGVIDPTKVSRSALQNAASIAGLLLTTECLVADVPEKEKPMPMPPGGPGGYGGDMY